MDYSSHFGFGEAYVNVDESDVDREPSEVDPDESDGSDMSTIGMTLELKKFDVRVDSKGHKTMLHTGMKYEFQTIEDESSDSAITITKTFSEKNLLMSTEMLIRSPFIVQAMKEVIVRYPDIDFEGDTIAIVGPPRCLFHYRDELAAYSENQAVGIMKRHISFALDYMKSIFASDIQHYTHCMLNRASSGGLDFERLWMAYRPGDVIYCEDGKEVFCGRLFRMVRSDAVHYSIWSLKMEKITCTGAGMEYQFFGVHIMKYAGLRKLNDLTILPLKHHERRRSIKEKLRARGEKLFKLRGVHQRYYRGHARWAHDPAQGREDHYDSGEYPMTKFLVRSRAMIDAEAFGDHRPNHKPNTRTNSTTSALDPNHEGEEQLLICDTQILGYSLTDKRWCAFDVDLVQDIELSGKAFNNLLLPNEQKSTLASLVEVHTNEALQFGDLIQDKGKGMIFLLHGDPGTGKTLTAESISDYVQRPLYPLRSGDLGITAPALETNLSEAFTLGERWNAIILLDEADVFLEIRRRNELLRNSLVAVFLRALEYYEGIMFLTTNRVDAFDPAFKSRIHLTVHYPPLCEGFRRELWSNFIDNGIADDVDPSVQDTMFLNEMAQLDFNGRQIRNVVRTAYSLAVSWNEKLSETHVRTTLEAMHTFEGVAERERSDTDDVEENDTPRPKKKRRRIG